MELKERIAKLAYQYANLIDDKKIDQCWFVLKNRERWFYFAEEAISIIKAN